MRLKPFIPLLFILLCNEILAQDIHFSQFYASPLSLNPAMSGKIANKYRIAANYRNQWGSVSVPFVTFSGSFDLPFATKQMKNNFFGAGLFIVSDKTGSGNLATQAAYISFAYHQKLAKKRIRHPKHYLSMGLQAGYVQKSVDINKLVFASEWNPSSKTFTNPSLESFRAGGNISYADFTGGLMVSSFFSEMFALYGGLTFHHLSTPKESFLVGAADTNKINNRSTFHLGSKVGINDKIFLNPSFLYLNQTKGQDIVFGTSLSFILNNDLSAPTAFYIGSWYRVGDAIVALVGYEIHNTRFGISYDINLSSLSPASANRGGLEFTLVHEGNPKTAPRRVIYCPRF
jgi:type IX secretion system PorP/SprF family membrane protein